MASTRDLNVAIVVGLIRRLNSFWHSGLGSKFRRVTWKIGISEAGTKVGPDHQSGSHQLGSTKNYENYRTKTFYPYCRLNVFSRNCHNQVQSRKVLQRSSVAWGGVHPPFCFTSASSTRIVALQVQSIYGSHHGPT